MNKVLIKTILILGLFILIFVGALSNSTFQPAEAAMQVSSDCNLCHDSIVSKFPSPSVEKLIICQICHYSSHGWASAVTPYGNFQTVNSPESLPAYLHSVHGGINGQSTTTGCNSCHAPVSCNICHGTINHSAHSTTTNPPANYQVVDAVYGSTVLVTEPLSCANSKCHGTWEKVVRKKTDGNDLCFNCHSTGLSGHGNLDVKHQTSFTSQLSSPTGPVIVNCNQCHKDQLNQEHLNKVNDCSNCHGSSVRADVQAVMASAKATTDPTQDLLAKQCFKCHIDPPLKHQPAHAAIIDSITDTTSLHTNCNTCHANTTVAATVYSLANSNTGYSCLDCHNANKITPPLHKAVFSGNNTEYELPGLHDDCATCHGNSKVIDPANNTTINTKVNSVVANKPTSAYSCNECHTGAMQPRHSAAMTVNGAVYDTVAFHPNCTTCHDKSTNNANLTNAINQLMAGQGSYLCEDCHNNQVASTPKHQVGTGIGNSVVDSVSYHPDCTTCHANPTAQAKIRVLKQQTNYVCSDCHNGSVAPLANHQATLSQNNSTYSTPEMHPSCDTCHQSADLNVKTQIKNHVGQATYSCEICHTGSLQPRHQALQEAGGTLVETTGFHPSCTTCHGRQDLITTISTLKANNPYMCYDCHNGQAAKSPQHVAKLKSTDAEAVVTVGFHPTGCANCHNANVEAKVKLAAANTGGYECGLCHDGSVAGTPSHTAQYELNGTPSDTTNIHPACTTCHGNTNSKITNLQTVIGDLKTAVKAGQTSYQCSVCHGDINALHVSPSDLSSNLNMINCSWCHSKQLLDTHLKPVVKLNQAMSCETCHSNTTPEGIKNAISLQMKGCDDCHNGAANAAPGIHPDSQYLPKHNGIFPEFTGITGYPSPDCKVCHNNGSGGEPNIAPYHMDILNKSIGCKSCHSNNLAYKPAVVSQSTNCSGCHQAKMEQRHVAFHTVADAVYNTVTPTATSAECLSCHALPGSTLSTLLDVHKKRATSTVTCDTCHAETARIPVPAVIAANNKACEACHTNGGHQHNVTAFETDANLSKVTCANCHATDATTNSTELSKLHADRGFVCATCHNDKFEVQNQIIVKDGAIYVPVCSTCHNNTLAPSMDKYPQHTGTDTSHGSATSIGNYTFGGNVDCTSCHSSLTNGSFALSPVHNKVTCDTCHSSSVANVKSVISSNMSRQTIKTPYTCADCHNSLPNKHLPEHKAISTEQVNCKNCHSFNATVAVATSDIHVTKGCDSCHGANVPQVIKDFVTPKVGQVNPVYNCENCHSQLPGGHNKNHLVNSYLTASTNTECAGCHDQDIAVLHSGIVGSKTLGCNSCHGDVLSTTAPMATKTVIAANLSTNTARTGFSCDSCHTSIKDGGHKHPVASFETSPQVDCAQCHTTDTVANTTDLAQLHTAKNVSCASCHNSTFEGGANPIIVKDGTVNVPTCSTCHNGTLAPDAGVKYPEHSGSATSHTTATGFGTYNDPLSQGSDCASCHTSLAVSSVHSTLTCNTCHTSSVASVKQVITGNLSSVVTKPGFACADCHNSLPVKHAPEHQAVNNIETTNVTCSNCHSFNVGYNATAVTTTLHTKNSCATCHSSTAPASVKLFVAGKAGLTNLAYSCNDCHATLTGQHNKQHTANSYLTGSTTADCVGCHNTLEVSQLHTGTTGSGKVLTCESCHGATAPTWAKTVIDANLSSNAARTGFSCDSCHTSVKGGGHKHPVSSFATSPQVDCAQCHTTDTVAKTTDLAQLHAAENIGCASCHNATFESGTNPVIIKDGVVNVPTCVACHDGTKAPQAETAYPEHNSTITTTHSSAASYGTYALAGSVNCAGCHTTLNIRPVHQTVDCNKCHTSTTAAVQSVISSNWSRQTTKAPYSCADCHTAVTTAATTKHQPVHTASSFTLDTTDVESCTTCHSTKVLTDLHVGKTNKAGAVMTCDSCHNSTDPKVMTFISQQARSVTTTYSCDSCHTLHGNGDHTATLPVGLTAEPNLKCAHCHDNDTATAGVTDLATEHTRRVNAATGQNYTCEICHNSTKTEVRNAIAAKDKNCSTCHLAGWHNDLNTPHSSTYVTNPAYQCANCHGNVLSDKSLHPDAVAGTITVGGGPVSYKLYRGTDGVSFTEIATSAVNSFSDTGLTANTQYYYQTAAVDQAGNVSTKSNVAYATAAVQETTTTVNPTSAQYRNQSSNGDTSSDGSFSSLSPSALTRLTDGRDSAGGSYDVRVQENSSNDRWIYVRIANDAKDDTKVVLDIRASWTSADSTGNLLIYPYQSNGTSINTAAVVNYKITNPTASGTFTTYSVDVTTAAHTMDNFGFMKFRIKPGTDGSRRDAYISEVDYKLTTGTAGASGTSAGNPGTATITGSGGDTTAPSTPASLTATGISTSQIDLNWTASTDSTQTMNQPGQSNCLKCHDSTQPNIMTAVTTQKTNCDACHTVHGDPNVLHNTIFVLNPTMACATCHQSRVDNEHLSRKSPTTGLQYTCDTCHKSTDPLVQGAIANNDTKCSTCHSTRHTNVQSVHVSNYIPDTTVDCAGCHTATKSVFTSSSNKALHEIAGTNSLATDGTYVSGYTKTSTLDCRGCHSATNGTYFGKILVKPYTASTGNSSTTGDLCFLCHDFRAYGTGGSYTAETYSGFSLADSRTNLHVIGDHKGGCQLCHSTKPHAQTNREHFIVLKGEQNAGTTAQLTKFIHRTNKAYTKNSCSAGCGSGDHP